MTDTMRIWNAVSKTDPKHTKKVNQRGGFTSICAQSQIMEATRAFGPIGQGWGYIASDPVFQDNLVFVQVTLWHTDRANTFGPVTGGAEWKSDKGRLDSDAPKKATTDAITKLLSQLGFNADVFLGLYDDNKYVQQVAREFAGTEQSTRTEQSDAGPALITDEQREYLMSMLDNLDIPATDFLRVGNIKDLRDMEASEFEAAKAWINKEAKRRRAAQQKEAA